MGNGKARERQRALREEKEKETGEAWVKEEALRIMAPYQLLPRLVVFDLDYTLWPFYCECRPKGQMPSLYQDARGISFALKDKGVDVAIASRSTAADNAKTFLEKLGIQSLFVAQEIGPSQNHKTDHFQRIQRRTGIPYKHMLFFDDEHGNIDSVSKMGVTSILVENGLNLDKFKLGLTNFASSRASDQE